MLFEKSQKVHSFYNENKSKTYLLVDLPKTENTKLKEERILSWVYWIGVDQEGKESYEKSLKSVSNLVRKIASNYYQTPLAAFAVGGITEFIIPKTGEDVQYYFINNFFNVQSF
jgi:hypothetical protein